VTTIRELVSEAFRENNLTLVGDVPDGAEYNEAEKRLLRIISSTFGIAFGEPLETVIHNRDEQEPLLPNVRLLVTSDTFNTVTLAKTPYDGQRFAVVDPEGLLAASPLVVTTEAGTVEGVTSITLDTAGLIREWFYRADTGNWVRVTGLTAESESPFPPEFDDLLTQWLAIRIATRYGVQTSAESSQVYRDILKMFKARYRQNRPIRAEYGLLPHYYSHGFVNWNRS